MAVRPPRFTAIPNIPQQGLTDWQFVTLNAMKENLELLIGARGNSAVSAAAFLAGAGAGAGAFTSAGVKMAPFMAHLTSGRTGP